MRVRRVDGRDHVLDGGFLAGLAELNRRFEFVLDRLANLLQPFWRHRFLGADGLLDPFYRIAPLDPVVIFFLGPRVAEIGAHRVLAPAIGHRLYQCRSVAGARPFHGFPHSQVHFHCVVAVDGDARHFIARCPARDLLDRCGLLVGRAEGVLIVLADEYDWQFPDRG